MWDLFLIAAGLFFFGVVPEIIKNLGSPRTCLGEQDRIIVQELKARFPAAARARLVRLILYGSRARGEAVTDSDLDLIALVDEKTPELEAQRDEAA